VPKESGEFWQIEGRKSITNKINQILSDASRSVSYSTTATGLIRVYKAHSEVLENARKRGAEVRVLSSITPENSGVARELAEVVQVKRLDKGFHSNFVSVDAQQLVVIDSRPEDLRTDRGTDRAIWTTNKMLIELHEQFFERVWSLAQVVNRGKD
jgi:sugar-specific transcriptional regulator TrmB